MVTGGLGFIGSHTVVELQKEGYEVIIIDSHSTDQTLDIVKKYPVRLHEIPLNKFSHSKTRNLGASLSKADKYLIFLNHDAVPTDENWLDNMIKSIEYEPDLKAACAVELKESRNYFNVAGVGTYVFKNSAARGIYIIEPYILSTFSNLPKEKQRELFPFTTVCAVFSKKHFEEYPFNENVLWGEDLHWAVDNSNNGFKSACSSFARVYHYHDYSRKELKDIEANTVKVYSEIFGIDKVRIKRKAKGRLVQLIELLQKPR